MFDFLALLAILVVRPLVNLKEDLTFFEDAFHIHNSDKHAAFRNSDPSFFFEIDKLAQNHILEDLRENRFLVQIKFVFRLFNLGIRNQSHLKHSSKFLAWSEKYVDVAMDITNLNGFTILRFDGFVDLPLKPTYDFSGIEHLLSVIALLQNHFFGNATAPQKHDDLPVEEPLTESSATNH